MRRLPIAVLTVLAATLAGPAAAHAKFFLGDAIDGPSADIVSVGDVDLARDGTGAVAYIKRVGGVDRAFVKRFSNGVFGAPEQVDGTLPGASSQVVVAASDNGRLLVGYVNGGTVYGQVKPRGDNPLSAPTPLAPGGDPAAALSINGTGYVSFTAAGDVRVARLDRRTNAWAVLPQAADASPTRAAGEGTGRSRVSVSADGIGLVVWGEAGHVYARKMFNTGLSNAPQDLTPASVGEQATGASDLPELDTEDDSSYAWVAWRQALANGTSRVLAARQRGTGFDPPSPVDDGSEPAAAPRVGMSGRGVGLITAAGTTSNQPFSAVLQDDELAAGGRISAPGTLAPLAVPVAAENNSALVAAIASPAGGAPSVRLRPYDGDGRPQGEANLSRPELGPVDAAAGFDAASDRAFGVVATWIQGTGADRRLVAGYLDREPLSFRGNTAQRCCRTARPVLSWAPAFDLWGAVSYQLLVDGRPAGQTTDSKLQVPTRLRGGSHRWQVVATDARGQQKRSRTRLVRVDPRPPRQSVSYKRRGRTVTLAVRAREAKGGRSSRSGLRGITIGWGDGARTSARSRVRTSHRYRRSGRYSLIVTTRDRAGNEAVRRRSVRIGG